MLSKRVGESLSLSGNHLTSGEDHQSGGVNKVTFHLKWLTISLLFFWKGNCEFCCWCDVASCVKRGDAETRAFFRPKSILGFRALKRGVDAVPQPPQNEWWGPTHTYGQLEQTLETWLHSISSVYGPFKGVRLSYALSVRKVFIIKVIPLACSKLGGHHTILWLLY